MITVQEALTKLYTSVPSCKNLTYIPLEESLGRIIAQPIYAKLALPIADNSAMDGYVLGKENLNKRYKIQGIQLAGEVWSGTLSQGEALKIMTGAIIPQGGECVIPIEDIVNVIDNEVTIECYKRGANIRYKGEDIASNELLAIQGERITPALMAILASQGITHVCVYQKPRIVIISTGSELKPHFQSLNEGELYNSNALFLQASIQMLGLNADISLIETDTLEGIKTSLLSLSQRYDCIITTGGASVGDADFTYQALKELNAIELFNKVAIKPGKPVKCMQVNHCYVMVLPGNPYACAVNYYIFGRTLLALLQGNHQPLALMRIQTTQKISVKEGMTSIIVGKIDDKGFSASPIQGPNKLSSLWRQNGLALVNESCQAYDDVLVLRIDGYGVE